MFTAEEQEQHVMERLVHDLETRTTLCCSLDYPGVSEKELNTYIREHGPLVNLAFGEVYGYWIDEDYFTPYLNVVPGCCELAPVIGVPLMNWAKWSGKRGTVFFSKELTYSMSAQEDPPPNPENLHLWEYTGQPYAPSFVVEIDFLSGEESQLIALDRKMKNQYFRHGVQLGWLIDPRPGFRKMLEYKRDEAGRVYQEVNDEWRDLDGGNVLPGFSLSKTDLEMVLDR